MDPQRAVRVTPGNVRRRRPLQADGLRGALRSHRFTSHTRTVCNQRSPRRNDEDRDRRRGADGALRRPPSERGSSPRDHRLRDPCVRSGARSTTSSDWASRCAGPRRSSGSPSTTPAPTSGSTGSLSASTLRSSRHRRRRRRRCSPAPASGATLLGVTARAGLLRRARRRGPAGGSARRARPDGRGPPRRGAATGACHPTRASRTPALAGATSHWVDRRTRRLRGPQRPHLAAARSRGLHRQPAVDPRCRPASPEAPKPVDAGGVLRDERHAHHDRRRVGGRHVRGVRGRGHLAGARIRAGRSARMRSGPRRAGGQRPDRPDRRAGRPATSPRVHLGRPRTRSAS